MEGGGEAEKIVKGGKKRGQTGKNREKQKKTSSWKCLRLKRVIHTPPFVGKIRVGWKINYLKLHEQKPKIEYI